MRIAINTLSENPHAPSGAQGYYINLLNELSRVGSEHTFFLFVSRANQHLFGPYPECNVRKVIFPYSNERRNLRVLTEHFLFAPVIKKYHIDVLNTGVAPLFCPCKLVVTMKTMHVYTNPRELTRSTVFYRKLLYRLTVKKADAIISNSISQSNDLKKYLNVEERKIKLVYEALDHSLFRPAKDSVPLKINLKKYGISKPYILFVSSLFPYKNAETLIQAFAQIKSQEPAPMLVIAGFKRDEGYYRKLTDLVTENQLQQDVVFTGGLDHEQLAKFYQGASVFVYPSYYETFGLTILEAMACGCPVITTNVSSMPEIAGNAALLFNPKGTGELSKQILRILSDACLRNELIAKGLHRAGEFTWRKTAENTLAAILN